MIIDVSTIIPAIAFILYVVFAVFGFLQYRKDRFYWSFQLYMIFFAIWSFGSMMMHLNSSILTPLAWNKVMLVGLLSAPFPLVHFILDIMEIKIRSIRLFVYYSYLFILLLLYLNISGQVVSGAEFDEMGNFHYILGRGAVIAYSIAYVYMILTLLILFIGKRSKNNMHYGKDIYLPLIGVAITLIGIATNINPILGRYPFDILGATINAFLLFYTIYKFKLINYSRLGLSIIFSTILAIVAALAYFVILFMISIFNEDFAPYNITQLSIVLGIVTVIVIHPIRNFISYLIDKIIIPKRHPYQGTIKGLSQRLTTIVDLNELGEEVVGTLKNGLKTDWVLFVVKEINDSEDMFKVISNNNCKTNVKLGAKVKFTFTEKVKRQLMNFQKENSSSILYATPDEPKFMTSAKLPDSDVMIPLIFRKKIAGYILIGFDYEKIMMSKIELEALEILAAQCSLSLKNALSFEQLRNQGNELIMSNNKLEAIFNGIASPVCMIDIDYTIREVNSAACGFVGKNRDEMISKKCYRVLFNRTRPCSYCKALDCLHAGAMKTTEAEVEDKVYSFQFHTIRVPQNSKGQFIEIINDVTETKTLQEELVRTEKMAGIGTLAAGIAHELNNPLAGILGTGEIMLSDIEEDSPMKEYIEDIISYSKTAADVIKELSVYTRKEEKEMQEVDIVRVLEFSLRLASRGSESKNITVKRNYHALPTIEANESELQQLFLNLIVNAMHAMDGKGTLTLHCKEIKGFVHVSVKDTGSGISEKNLNQIFTPFFTTKAPGKGTGLGLSNCYKIVENMDGRIRVKSEEGQGAEFLVIFPINEDGKTNISFSLVTDDAALNDVFYIQRKVLVGEKGYLEESIHRDIDEKAVHILAYQGIQPVGTVSLLTSDHVWPLPISKNFDIESVLQTRKCSEIIRLAVLPEMRNTTVSIGLIMLVFLFARYLGVEEMIIDVFQSDKKTIKLYKKFGFKEVGVFNSPDPVTVLILQSKTTYEKDNKQLHHFIKPLYKKLINMFDFGEHTPGIIEEMNRIVPLEVVEQTAEVNDYLDEFIP